MSFLQNIQSGIKNYLDKKKEDREFERRLQLEADVQRRIVYEEQFKINSLEVAKAQAKKEAAKNTGLQKLRAMNRSRNLEHQSSNPSIFQKLSEYTQKNLAKREENMKVTAELRHAGKTMRQDKLSENRKLREERMSKNLNRPFGGGGW